MDDVQTIKSWDEVGISPPNTGGEWRTQCPVCSAGRKPQNQNVKCLSIAANRETAFCQHCSASFNILTKGGAMNPTFTPLSQRPKEYTRPAPTQDNDTAWESFAALLSSRSLDAGMIRSTHKVAAIGSPSGPVMAMPYHNVDGELINHKYRTLDKKFWMDQGAERGFYNIHNVVDADVIVIVEGEMDVYALEEAGWPHVISVPDGAPSPSARNYTTKFDFLEAAAPVFGQASRVIIAVDSDEPGQRLRDELQQRIGALTSIAHVHWPEGIKDANEYLVAHGPKALKQVIVNAEPEPEAGVFTGEDLWTEIEDAYDNGYDKGTPMGFPDLDKIYRPTVGHFTVIVGHPGSGKSTVLDNLLVRLATLQNWPVAYFSPEQQPMSRHMGNLIEIYLKRPMFLRKGVEQEDRISKEEAQEANEFLSQLISFISPEQVDEDPTIDRILELATAEVYRRGIKVLVIDPWNELEHARPKNMDNGEYVSSILQKLRSWARRMGVHIFLLAHPTKMQGEDGKDAIPGLSNIYGSYAFRAKADYGLSIHRDQQADDPYVRNLVTIYVLKSRWRDAAEAGTKTTFLYDGTNNTIKTPPFYPGEPT